MKPATDYRAGNPARYHAHWLLRDGDRIVGPVSLELLERGIRAGKVPLTAEMALDGHDEWLPIGRVLPRVRPDVLALPAPKLATEAGPSPESDGAVAVVPVRAITAEDAPPPAETMPETPTALDAPPTGATPPGEDSQIRARKTCIMWPAPALVRQIEAIAAAEAAESESEIVEGELVDEEWKRATVRKRPSSLPQDWRHRTVLCAPEDEDEDEQAVAEVFAAAQPDAQDAEREGPVTERMHAPETDRMPNVGEPDPVEARDAQMRAWQATTQQRRIAPGVAAHGSQHPSPAPAPVAQHPSQYPSSQYPSPQHPSQPPVAQHPSQYPSPQHPSQPPVAQHPSQPPVAQHPSQPPVAQASQAPQPWAERPWAAPPVPQDGQPWHQQPWYGSGDGES